MRGRGTFRRRNRRNDHRQMGTRFDADASEYYDHPHKQLLWTRVRSNEQPTSRTKATKASARSDDRDDVKAHEVMEPRCPPIAASNKIVCIECGAKGHWAHECPVRKKELMRKHGDRCNRCGRKGHWARDCRATDGVSKMEYLRSIHGSTCNRCGRPGHWARDCVESYNGPGYHNF